MLAGNDVEDDDEDDDDDDEPRSGLFCNILITGIDLTGPEQQTKWVKKVKLNTGWFFREVVK